MPDSNLKLVDGNVVILARLPGLKWVLHDGWYNYNGHQYKGWYFASIPSQTILPVNPSDLRMITVVSTKNNDMDPEFPDHHHCYPDDPGGLFPPVPPTPEPEKPAFFSKKLKQQLDQAFISVPNIKKRNELNRGKCKVPDGKIVRVNNVEGKVKYYEWSALEDEWLELDVVTSADLENYYTKDEVDAAIQDARAVWEFI